MNNLPNKTDILNSKEIMATATEQKKVDLQSIKKYLREKKVE